MTSRQAEVVFKTELDPTSTTALARSSAYRTLQRPLARGWLIVKNMGRTRADGPGRQEEAIKL